MPFAISFTDINAAKTKAIRLVRSLSLHAHRQQSKVIQAAPLGQPVGAWGLQLHSPSKVRQLAVN